MTCCCEPLLLFSEVPELTNISSAFCVRVYPLPRSISCILANTPRCAISEGARRPCSHSCRVRRDTPSLAADSSRVHPRCVRQVNKRSAKSCFLERAMLIVTSFYFIPVTSCSKTGISNHCRPSRMFPAAFLCTPPHCLRKKGMWWYRHCLWRVFTQYFFIGLAPGPLSPPTISQSMYST